MTFTEKAEEVFALKTRQYELGIGRESDFASTGEDGVLYRLLIGDAEGTLAGDLARSMGLTSGRIANILKQLEAKGYVARSTGQSDRRQVNVQLTEEGRSHIRDAYDDNIRVIEENLRLLGEADANEYIRILGRIIETFPQSGAETVKE